jgi:hypothetical protein
MVKLSRRFFSSGTLLRKAYTSPLLRLVFSSAIAKSFDYFWLSRFAAFVPPQFGGVKWAGFGMPACVCPLVSQILVSIMDIPKEPLIFLKYTYCI